MALTCNVQRRVSTASFAVRIMGYAFVDTGIQIFADLKREEYDIRAGFKVNSLWGPREWGNDSKHLPAERRAILMANRLALVSPPTSEEAFHLLAMSLLAVGPLLLYNLSISTGHLFRQRSLASNAIGNFKVSLAHNYCNVCLTQCDRFISWNNRVNRVLQNLWWSSGFTYDTNK